MRKYILIACLFFGDYLMAQPTINQYQYVIVPSKFSFTPKKNNYNLSILTKLLLEKYGFKAYLDNEELPEATKNLKCDKLYADLASSGNFTMTKVQVVLKDCKKGVVYQSAIGVSKAKEYKTAYTQGVREAFQSFETLNHHYNPSGNFIEEPPMSKELDTKNLLLAEEISNGYKLIDANEKVIMKVFKTSNPTMFTAVKKKKEGVLISKDHQWYFEYYQENKLISEKINVKF